MIKKYIINTFFITLTTATLFAQDKSFSSKNEYKELAYQESFRKVSIDTGYFVDHGSNRAYADFGVELFQAYGYGYDAIHRLCQPNNSLSRGILFAGNTLIIVPLAKAYLTTYHEFGHYSRAHHFGSKPFFDNRPNTFFGFFVDKLFSSPFSGESTSYYPNDYSSTTDGSITIAAAGINNEMRFAGELTDTMWKKQGHIVDVVPYMYGKLSSVDYKYAKNASNDIYVLENHYKTKGYGIKKSNMDTANWISFLGSASTYAYFIGLFNYSQTGDTAVRSLEWNGWRLPDIESYMTAKGISYKVKSGYRVDNTLLIPFSIEWVAKGGRQMELAVGAQKRIEELKNILVEGSVLLGKRIGFEAIATYPIQKNFSITTGLSYYRAKTLYGERNITSGSHKKNKLDGWLKASYCY